MRYVAGSIVAMFAMISSIVNAPSLDDLDGGSTPTPSAVTTQATFSGLVAFEAQGTIATATPTPVEIYPVGPRSGPY